MASGNLLLMSAICSVPISTVASMPSWCQWVPAASRQYVADCQDGTITPGRSCSSWCQWVPTPSWMYVSSCGGCTPRANPGTVSPPISPPSTGCAGWCQQIPAEPRANLRDCGGCMPAPGTPPSSSQECGDLSATENQVCSEDVQFASTGGKNDPHAASWYADMKEIT